MASLGCVVRLSPSRLLCCEIQPWYGSHCASLSAEDCLRKCERIRPLTPPLRFVGRIWSQPALCQTRQATDSEDTQPACRTRQWGTVSASLWLSVLPVWLRDLSPHRVSRPRQGRPTSYREADGQDPKSTFSGSRCDEDQPSGARGRRGADDHPFRVTRGPIGCCSMPLRSKLASHLPSLLRRLDISQRPDPKLGIHVT